MLSWDTSFSSPIVLRYEEDGEEFESGYDDFEEDEELEDDGDFEEGEEDDYEDYEDEFDEDEPKPGRRRREDWE